MPHIYAGAEPSICINGFPVDTNSYSFFKQFGMLYDMSDEDAIEVLEMSCERIKKVIKQSEKDGTDSKNIEKWYSVLAELQAECDSLT